MYDVITMTERTKEERGNTLREIFKIVDQNGSEVNADKCEVAESSIECLVQKISEIVGNFEKAPSKRCQRSISKNWKKI